MGKQLTLFLRAGQTIDCPHCKGKGGKTELLYYWVPCYLCHGHKKIKIEKIIQEDNRHGDVKAEISFPTSCGTKQNETNWLI
jgi:DnaJ-class molecular chaperone